MRDVGRGARQVPHTVWRWSRSEYDRLVELGAFEGEPLELIGGELIVTEPKSPAHSSGVTIVDYAVRAVLPSGWVVRVQAPIALDDDSEPEPDLVVVPGSHRDYVDAHPARPALVVEVAESSLAFDRGPKASLYARAGLPDYWIVNLIEHVVEVHRDPTPDPSAAFGWRYGSITSLGPTASVSPLALPAIGIAVEALLPGRRQ